jgi:putative tryptophan/tyrosine transport system substrate-binding protein
MRRFFGMLWLTVAAGMILIPSLRAHAAAVCVVMSNESAQFNETVEGFKKHLTQQAVSVEITMHSLSRDGSQPQDIARSLSQAKATHLLVLGSQASQLAAQGNFGQPAIAGLVFSMADLAGTPDVTGVYLDIGVDAQLALIKRLFPQAARVGVLYSVENEKKIAEAAKIAQKHGLKLEAQEAFAPKDIPPALESVGKRADLLWGLMDKVVLTPETTKQILLFSLRNALPFVGPSENWAKAGAAAAFSWNFEDLGAQCAEILLKLLKGAKAADLAAVGPRKVEYVLNLKIADQLKIDFSPEIINHSKRVFKGE